jgi:hypothetical protein
MGEINKSQGKVEDANRATLLTSNASPLWPPLMVSSHESGEEYFSRPAAGIHARIVLASYRASAEMYLSEWRDVVLSAFKNHMDVEMVEMAVCDVAVRWLHTNAAMLNECDANQLSYVLLQWTSAGIDARCTSSPTVQQPVQACSVRV